MKFEEILKTKYNINPTTYMNKARKRANSLGYTSELKFSDDGQHKLEYQGEKFGNVDNKDFIIYSLTEGKEKADRMKKAYHARTFAPGRKITQKMRYTAINW